MRVWVSILMAGLICASAATARAASVGSIEIRGAIGPATASYIARAIEVAAGRGDACLVIQLNTPGGLVSSTQDIVESFYAARIPVVVFVTPSGASATSAGTFITIAADIAAMAPNTRIGAAHPVAMGGGGEGTNGVMQTKAQNDLAMFIRSIAEKRGRNADWAESAVRESASITSETAVELNVVDLIADGMTDLLQQIDGRVVNDAELKTAGAKVVPIPMALRERVFQMLWRPEVMLILMLIAIYGIIGELSNPGAILPGVLGAIALILVLYMSAILPINVAGLALIALAVVLFIADVFTPSHGILTFGGIISFFLGALMLFNRGDPGLRLSLAYIIPATLLTASFFVFVVAAGLRAQLLPVKVGRETLLGLTTPALARIDARNGKVFVEGEYWNAVSDVTIEQGQLVEVVAVDGLTLKVKPKNP